MSESSPRLWPQDARTDPGEHQPFHVRPATIADTPAIGEALAGLLSELGGAVPPAADLAHSAQTIVDDPDSGSLLVAACSDSILGVLAASWQYAIHVPGRYGIVQDLWVHPAWRSRAVGTELLKRLFEQMSELGMARVEVGLPSERFAGLDQTTCFYRANGFSLLGPRMRLVLE